MGITTVKLTVRNPMHPAKKITENFLVDTGAHYTILPQDAVKKLGLRPSFKQEFALADGKVISRNIGSALITYDGKEMAAPVVLGEKGDDAILGVTTLESFGLMVDPFNRKIYHSKLMLT